MNPRKVNVFVHDYTAGLVKNNRPEEGLKLPTFYFIISVFQPPPWTLLMHGTCIHTEISQTPIFKGT